MPQLSIITINRNNAAGLQKTIDSVLSQTYNAFEYIIIDGGSTDGSVEIMNANKSNITYWVTEPDTGIYQAMNKGIAAAKGTYCLFLNSGDWLYKEDSLSSVMASVNSADIVSANLIQQIGPRMVKTYFPKKLGEDYFFSHSLPHPSTFIKRSLFNSVGFYNEAHKIVSDWEFFILAIKKHNSSFKKLQQFISVYNLDGVSNDVTNAVLMKKERDEVLEENFSGQLSNYNRVLKQKKSYKNQIGNFFNKIMRFSFRVIGNDIEIIK